MFFAVFQHSILILYRPFLILHAMEKIDEMKSGLNGDHAVDDREKHLIMSKARHFAIQAAERLIAFFSELYQTTMIQKVDIVATP